MGMLKEVGWDVERRGSRTAVACVGVGDEGDGGIEVRNHFGMGSHVVEVGDAEVGVAEEGGRRAGTSLGWLVRGR